MHYLRFSRYFVLVATHGVHPFFEQEAKAIRDVRRIPIKFGGYSIFLSEDLHGDFCDFPSLLVDLGHCGR